MRSSKKFLFLAMILTAGVCQISRAGGICEDQGTKISATQSAEIPKQLANSIIQDIDSILSIAGNGNRTPWKSIKYSLKNIERKRKTLTATRQGKEYKAILSQMANRSFAPETKYTSGCQTECCSGPTYHGCECGECGNDTSEPRSWTYRFWHDFCNQSHEWLCACYWLGTPTCTGPCCYVYQGLFAWDCSTARCARIGCSPELHREVDSELLKNWLNGVKKDLLGFIQFLNPEPGSQIGEFRLAENPSILPSAPLHEVMTEGQKGVYPNLL